MDSKKQRQLELILDGYANKLLNKEEAVEMISDMVCPTHSGVLPDITDDELYSEVMEYAKDKKQISISNLQRRFGIGYARAARFRDALEDAKG